MKSFLEKMVDALVTFSPIILLVFVCSCYLAYPVKKTRTVEDLMEKIKNPVTVVQDNTGGQVPGTDILHPSPISGMYLLFNSSSICTWSFYQKSLNINPFYITKNQFH